MDVSVILVARNAADTIGEQLDALATQHTDRTWELVVVDDASTDPTRNVIDAALDRFDSAELHTGDGDGANAARNLAASHAQGDLLVFCDADDRVAPGWIDALHRNSSQWDLAGGRLDTATLNAPRWQALRPNPTAHGLPVALNELRFAVGANLAVHRRTWADLAGFNPAYRYGTDVEFAFRAQRAGQRLGWVPDAVVAYRYRNTLAATWAQAARWGQADMRLVRDFDIPRCNLVHRPRRPRTLTSLDSLSFTVAYLAGITAGTITPQ